jgi:hypothetical protein
VVGAAAAIELTIFRHGPGGTLGMVGTVLLVVGGTIVALLAIRSARRSETSHAKAWAWLLCGAVAYFALASLVAEPLYEHGSFALGAPRTVTARRQIERAEANLERIASHRAASGYTDDQRWLIAVDRSQIDAARADLAYAKAVKESEQVYPQYPAGGEPGAYQQHILQLVDAVRLRRRQQGFPVVEPLPGYYLLPSAYAKRISVAQAQVAGAELQVKLCASGSAAGYRGLTTPAEIEGCRHDWMREARRHQDTIDYNQGLLDFERKAIATVAP